MPQHIEAYDQYVAALLPMVIKRYRDQLGHCFTDSLYPTILKDVDMIAAIMLEIRSKRWTS